MSPESLLSKKLKTRLLIGVAFGVLVYLAMALWADGPQIIEALRGFPPQWVLVACGLSFVNYVVRFVRWERYRAILAIEMGRWTAFRIYLAGLALTVTPGKMGEAFRSILIRAEDGTPIARSAPMVVAARFTDLLGFLILVAIGGIASSPEHQWVFWATLLLCAFLLFLVGSKTVGRFVIAVLSKLPLVHRFVPHAEAALDSSRVLLAPKELPLPTIISTFGWGCECYGFYLVCEALVPGGVTFLFATYTYALAAIAGAVLLIFPGGLGVTEASMGGLLAHRFRATANLTKDVAAAKALSATFLIRLCTLWFAVGVGLIALTWHSRLRKSAESGAEAAES